MKVKWRKIGEDILKLLTAPIWLPLFIVIWFVGTLVVAFIEEYMEERK